MLVIVMKNKIYITDNEKPFAIEDALLIQLEQVIELKPILSTGAYAFLLAEVARRNSKGYESPYDVFRGQQLLSYVTCNYSA